MKGLTYLSKYQNLHMDRAKKDSMKTVNVTFTTNRPSSSTPILLHEYAHGLGYTPQFWGLWDINYFPNVQSQYSYLTYNRRAYGYVVHNTGAGLTASFYYTVDSTHIRLYCHFQTTLSPVPNTIGMNVKFTGYLFSNDRNTQDYTK